MSDLGKVDWEGLRSPQTMQLPDIRRKNVSIEQLHDSLNKINLIDQVPESIKIQFETAKNLFLYSWNVYRFHHIADLQATSALELSLRTRFIELGIKFRKDKDSLRDLLQIAENNHLISVEDFPDFFIAARRKAKDRHLFEQLHKMMIEGLQEMEVDESKIETRPEDFDRSFLSNQINGLVKTRNLFAHGTTGVNHPSFAVLNLTQEIINIIFSKRET